jgi:DNA-binding transcriptional regulator YiaG
MRQEQRAILTHKGEKIEMTTKTITKKQKDALRALTEMTSLTGSEIRQKRIDSGLMQKECAEMVGLGIRQWQKIENGEQKCKQLYIDCVF